MEGIERRLKERLAQGRLRELQLTSGLVDFSSNDYLGLSSCKELKQKIKDSYLSSDFNIGASASRLVSAHSKQFEKLEIFLAEFHKAESALIFNSGYDANLGLFSSLAERKDTIIYDELSHASIRDGLRLGFSKSFAFRHNDLNDLEQKLSRAQGEKYIVVESVYSMDGDLAPIAEICDLAEKFDARVIVDEAHSTGILGPNGEGLVVELGIEDKVFARVHTFGKAIGCHGAVVVGPQLLKDFLVNFARSFIYSTALSPHSLLSIQEAYRYLPECGEKRKLLFENINFFKNQSKEFQFISNQPVAIQFVIFQGNMNCKLKAEKLRNKGLDVKAILSPTVPEGQERIRICLHSFNTHEEIKMLVQELNL